MKRLKTKNAARQIDLHSSIAAELMKFIGDRKSGLVFETRNGRPHSQANMLQRHLYPILESLGIPQCGFHAFRRFRTTHLRKQRIQESLIRYWMAHSQGSKATVTDLYDRTAEDVAHRKSISEQVGIGFSIPRTDALNVLKSEGKEAA